MGMSHAEAPTPVWPTERIGTLKHLWGQGLSASVIAQRMGTTRNAFIGKVHRIKLPPRKPRVCVRRVRRPRPAYRFAAKPQHRPETKTDVVDQVLCNLIANQDMPEALRITVLNIRDGMCRWPVGDPREPGFGFCGHKTYGGKSYCPQHALRAVRPWAREAS